MILYIPYFYLQHRTAAFPASSEKHADVAHGYLEGRNLRLATQRIHLGLQLVFELTVCDTKQFEMYLNLKSHTTKRCQTDVSVSWIDIPNHTF